MHAHHKELARHALGLDGRHDTSYRNHFVVGKGCPDYGAWMEMVAAGDATRTDGAKLHYGGDDMFNLTRVGAEKALNAGEHLEDDFN